MTILTASGDTRSDLKLPDVMNPAPPGASELSGKIRTLLKEEKEFFLIVQSACGIEQIMDVKVMTQSTCAEVQTSVTDDVRKPPNAVS